MTIDEVLGKLDRIVADYRRRVEIDVLTHPKFGHDLDLLDAQLAAYDHTLTAWRADMERTVRTIAATGIDPRVEANSEHAPNLSNGS